MSTESPFITGLKNAGPITQRVAQRFTVSGYGPLDTHEAELIADAMVEDQTGFSGAHDRATLKDRTAERADRWDAADRIKLRAKIAASISEYHPDNQALMYQQLARGNGSTLAAAIDQRNAENMAALLSSLRPASLAAAS